MPRCSLEDLHRRLNQAKPVPAILLLGEEPYLRDACRAQLIDKFVPEAARTWAVSRYSAGREETQSALEQAQTMPMLASCQLVFLEDVQQIEKLAEENRDATVQQLQGYLDDPAPFTVLVLEATALDQRMKLAKILFDGALVVDATPGHTPEQRMATAVVMAGVMAEEQQVEFEKGAAEDLAEFVAADLTRLKTEVEKLATYVGGRKRIRRQDVAAMVISEKITTVWELASLLVSGQQKKALEFLDRLLRAGEEPLPMLGAMAWMYRKLIEASELKGITGWQAARVLGMRAEQAELAVESARKIPKARLLEGLQALQKADDRLKRGGGDARAVLEFLVIQLTSPQSSKASSA